MVQSRRCRVENRLVKRVNRLDNSIGGFIAATLQWYDHWNRCPICQSSRKVIDIGSAQVKKRPSTL
jgi:hypothetical protein